MAHFYGVIKGARGQATRCGGRDSGMDTIAASWAGAVRVHAYDRGGTDWVRVEMMPWRGAGTHRVLYEGPIGEYMNTVDTPDT